MDNTSLAKRNIVLAVMMILLCLWSFLYVKGTGDLVRQYKEEVYTGIEDNSIYIDGADFTGLMQIGVAAASGIMWVIMMAFNIFMILIGDLIVSLTAYFAFVRRRENIIEEDIKFSRGFIWICTGVFLLLSLAATRFYVIAEALLLFWEVPLFASLCYLLPIKKKFRAQKMLAESEEQE